MPFQEIEEPGNPFFPFTPEQGTTLLHIARTAISQKFGQVCDRPKAADDPVFHSQFGVFVTLTKSGHLRGCIGSLSAVMPLGRAVEKNACAAAFDDPRFLPLTSEELSTVIIEVSVLTPPEAIYYQDGHALLDLLRPGVDGVVIRKNKKLATFLPQVWAELPQPDLFLDHLCLKAGLSKGDWQRQDLEIETYQVCSFCEYSPA